jgi:hypothetical protein
VKEADNFGSGMLAGCNWSVITAVLILTSSSGATGHDGPVKYRYKSGGCGGQRLRLCAHDQEPQHQRQLPEEGGVGDARDHILVLRQQ